MASNCVDKTDQTTVNKLALNNGVMTDDVGRYTLNQIDVFAQELIDNIASEAETNPVAIMFKKYGQELYDANAYVNALRDTLDTTDYPDLDRRWSTGAISDIEFADFINSYNYTPSGVINGQNIVLARNLDAYYKDTFSESVLGGFCRRMPQIFGQIDAFFELLDEIGGAIKDALEFVNKIRSYEGFAKLGEQAIIRKLLKELKKKLTEAIDKIFQKVEDAIAQFDISGVIGDAQTFYRKGVSKPIMTAKEEMCAFFTKENKKKLKDKFKALIDYAISLFESPNLEAVQFFIARFCAFITNIEGLLNDIKNPLDDYTVRFQSIANRLNAISNVNTSTAIRAGAIRFSPSARKEAINRLEARAIDEGMKDYSPTGQIETVPEPTAEEYGNLPKCGAVFAGNDSTFKVEGDSFDEKEGVGIYGYIRIDLDVKVYLHRVQKDIGGTLTITEGWISKKYNEAQEGDENNAHLSGLVVDIKKDMADPAAFMESALKNGFKYATEADDFIHLDIREIPGQ